MSLLSPDRVIVGLSPYHLSALRLKGGLWPHVVDKYDQSIETSDATRWEDAINALEVLLATETWSSGQITVVLSNHWVRYALVAGKPSLGADEQKILANIVFEKTYGSISLGWEIRTSPVSNDGAMVASGVPKRLIEEIRRVCGKRLKSIRPLLMPATHTATHVIKNNTGRLVIAEPGRVTLVSIHKGQWQSISSRAISASNEFASLKKILNEDLALQESSTGGLLWLCNIAGKLNMPSDSAGFTKVIEPKILAAKLNKDMPSLAYWGLQKRYATRGIWGRSSVIQAPWLDYQQSQPGHQWPGAVILVLGVALTGTVLHQYDDINQSLESKEKKVFQLKRLIEQTRLQVDDHKTDSDTNAIIQKTARSIQRWDSLFHDLEVAGDETVTLIGITSNLHEVSISGEAKDIDAALAYLERLQTSNTLSRIHITEQEILKDHPRHPLRFTFVSNWPEISQ